MSSCPAGAIALQAPAKLNLGLRILGTREDGYHLIESVFAPIELWDDVELEIEPGARRIELDVSSAVGSELPGPLSDVPGGPQNLVFRAVEAFCRLRDVEAEVRVRLRKRIPAAAGLGGGSSDAAAALLGLAALTDGEEPGGAGVAKGLGELALGLGADVPFFLTPGPAHVSGIGERIDPLAELPGLDLVVVNPGISLATAEVYRAADALAGALTQPGAGSTMRAISHLCLAREEEDLKDALGELLVNDLEPAARRLCPPVGRLADRLREAGAIGVSMTGSGATVFGVFISRERAEEAAEWIRSTDGSPGSDSRGSNREGKGGAWVTVTRLTGTSRAD